MCDLTYFQVLELTSRRHKCISLGKQYEKDNIIYDKSKLSDYEINFIEFGRFCEHHNLDSNDLNTYDRYLECNMKDWNVNNIEYESLEENQLYVFFNRLKTGEYKAIIIDERTPLILKDKRNLEFWENQLYCNLIDNIIEVGYDTLKIINKHNGKEIFLEGLEEITDGEIFARKYLDNCEFGLIVKDSIQQIQLKDDNLVKDVMDYYIKCKDIVNIRTVPEDSEHYLMNCDVIIVGYGEDEFYREEIWQPC